MSPSEHTDDQLNFYRVCRLATSIIPDGLRTVFKREWDARYGVSHGLWQNTAQNARDFYNMESPRNQSRNKLLLEKMKSGKRDEWDCTCLIYAILYSDSIRTALESSVSSSVDDLREFRNDFFAHKTDGKLKADAFKIAVQKVVTAFSCLKLDTTAIKKIQKEKSFTTEEVISLRKKVYEEQRKNCALEERLKEEQEKSSSLEEELHSEPKSFCVLPSKPSHETVSRPNEVKQIMEKMKTLRKKNKNQVTTIYLSGNPGCGKSQVARQIGESYYKDITEQSTADKEVVMTLNAENEEKLLQSYTEFAFQLRCTEYSTSSILKSDKLNLKEKINQLTLLTVSKLKDYSSWLLIVDVTDLKLVCQYWPRSGETVCGNGQVLITTQDSSSVSTDCHTSHVSLSEGMETNDARTALSKISGFSSEVAIETEVAKALDFQPLALVCAAVYVRRVRDAGQSFTWEEYLKLLKEDKRESTEKVYKDTSLSYSKTMTTAVRLAVQREMRDDDVMRHAFQYLSLLAPESLPLDYIVSYVKNFNLNEDEKLIAARIATCSLILYSGPDSNTVTVHQVVNSCLTRSIFTEDKKPGIDAITAAILSFSGIQSFDESSTKDIHASQQLLPHFSKLVQQTNDFCLNNFAELKRVWSKERGILLNCLEKIGRACRVHFCYPTARCSYKITLILKKHWYGENHYRVGVTLNNIGLIEMEQGKYDDAKNSFVKALDISETVLGPNHPNVAAALNNLGITAKSQGQYDVARRYYERALHISETVLGPGHPYVAATLNNLGRTAHRQGQYDTARRYYERALDIKKTVLGPDHPYVAATLNNLGNTAHKQCEYDTARRYYERALDIEETVLGPNHPDVANTLNNLGSTADKQGQYETARKYYERALDIRETVLGPDHPDVAAILNNLGTTAGSQGQYDSARRYYERALRIGDNSLSSCHPALKTIRNNLAHSYLHLWKIAGGLMYK